MTEGYDGSIWTRIWTQLRVYWHAAIYIYIYILESIYKSVGYASMHVFCRCCGVLVFMIGSLSFSVVVVVVVDVV